jgi:hypothetical protein
LGPLFHFLSRRTPHNVLLCITSAKQLRGEVIAAFILAGHFASKVYTSNITVCIPSPEKNGPESLLASLSEHIAQK